MKPTQRSTELLEVESDEEREARLGACLSTFRNSNSNRLFAERLLASKTGPSSTTGPDLTANFLGEKKTFNVPPPTDCENTQPYQLHDQLRATIVLARLEAFLPEMKKANDDLTQKIAVEGQKSVDIEHLGDDGEPLDEEDGETEASESSQRKPYIVMVRDSEY